jgi:hypothetical protein
LNNLFLKIEFNAGVDPFAPQVRSSPRAARGRDDQKNDVSKFFRGQAADINHFGPSKGAIDIMIRSWPWLIYPAPGRSGAYTQGADYRARHGRRRQRDGAQGAAYNEGNPGHQLSGLRLCGHSEERSVPRERSSRPLID